MLPVGTGPQGRLGPVPVPAPPAMARARPHPAVAARRDAAVGARRRPGAGASGAVDPGYAASATGPADPDGFSVQCLPVEAFEALFVVAYGLGDILVADEPYLLELYLTEPAPCFCRLSLVPEAGASLVTVEVSAAADTASAPEPAAVIDVLVTELNALVTS